MRVDCSLLSTADTAHRCDEGVDVGASTLAVLERVKRTSGDRAIPVLSTSDCAGHCCDRIGVAAEADGESERGLKPVMRQCRVEPGGERFGSIRRTSELCLDVRARIGWQPLDPVQRVTQLHRGCGAPLLRVPLRERLAGVRVSARKRELCV